MFGCNGEISTVNWDRLVSDLFVSKSQRLALVCAFLRSDFLYRNDLRLFLYDSEIRRIIRQRFSSLSEKKFFINKKKLLNYIISIQDNQCFFPHSAVDIYNNKIFVGSKDGLMSAGCNKKTKYGISTKVNKLWDGPVFSMAAKYSKIAIASGSEGLYELSIGLNYFDRELLRGLSDSDCSDCKWAYHSIFASSYEQSFLAEFHKMNQTDLLYGGYHSDADLRVFDGVLFANDLFGSTGYAWGVQDKLCQYTGDGIKVLKYQPWKQDGDKKSWSYLGNVPISGWKGDVISASVASFGVIVETENSLIVFPSAGQTKTFRGEPTNWRVFERSSYYENQLHVVYDDRIDILSFNHDYLVDQQSKVMGIYTHDRSTNAQGNGRLNALQELLER